MANEFLKSLSVNSPKKLNNFAVISTFISETALLLWSYLTKFVCHATGSGQVTGFGDGIAKMGKKIERLGRLK